MCACVHTVGYRGARAHTSTYQCVMLAEPHTEIMPNLEIGKLLVTNFQILGRIFSKLSSQWRKWNDYNFLIPFFLSHTSEIHKNHKLLKVKMHFFFFFMCVCVCVKTLQNEYFFCHINILVWYGVYSLWRIKVNKSV